VAGFWEFASEARMSATNFVAIIPTVIYGLGVEAYLATLFTSFIIEQSLEFPQLG
jgi:hypothetical protein